MSMEMITKMLKYLSQKSLDKDIYNVNINDKSQVVQVLLLMTLVHREVKTPSFQRHPLPFWATPPFLKIPEPPRPPPPTPNFKAKTFSDLKFYS